MSIADIMTSQGLSRSRGEARRLAAQGGVTVNGIRVSDVDQPAPVGAMEIRVGKSRFATIEVKP